MSSTVESRLSASFGVELLHTQLDANQAPPDQSARETMAEYILDSDVEAVMSVAAAANEVSSIIRVKQEADGGIMDLVDVFTADQLLEMSDRIHNYLGTDLESYLQDVQTPVGYPFYIGRLAVYFESSDADVTTQFGRFVTRHEDPKASAIGPFEENSRQYANSANQVVLDQLRTFYQAKFAIELVGPTKPVSGSRMSWERGVAECQFLVLDYIRDQVISGPRVSTRSQEVMTIEDIEHNLKNLLENRRMLVTQVNSVNRILATELEQAIDALQPFTLTALHRGRLDVPRFRKNPASARKAIQRAEGLLLQAAALAESQETQEDIPILDL